MFDLQNRILSNISPEPMSGCWLWTACLDGKDGYGRTWTRLAGRVKNIQAHRAAYMAFVGIIPDGLNVCHKCDTRPCVNPDHLFLGTQRQNIDDMNQKLRRGGNRKLTPLQIEEIVTTIDSSAKYGSRTKLANRFGVWPRTINTAYRKYKEASSV